MLIALALMQPPLTQAAPMLFGLWELWAKSIPALLITRGVLAAQTCARHRRGLAVLWMLYAVVALLAGGFPARMPDRMLSW